MRGNLDRSAMGLESLPHAQARWPQLPRRSGGAGCSRHLRGPPPSRGVSHTIIEGLVDSHGSPFHSLGLASHQQAGGYERAARRQVSQLRRLKADPGALALTGPPDWAALFADPSRPLVVDLGCGAGRCMLAAAVEAEAQAQARANQGGNGDSTIIGGSGCNFLGVDVRLALTSRANAWAEIAGVRHRAAFLCANANASLPQLLGSYGSHVTAAAAAAEAAPGAAAEAAPGAAAEAAPGAAASGAAGVAALRRGQNGGRGSGDDSGSSSGSASVGSTLKGGERSVDGDGGGGGGGTDGPPGGAAGGSLSGSVGGVACGDADLRSGACSGGGGGGSRSGGQSGVARGEGRGGAGRVALVCLQFSDPPVRRQALVGGGELVSQLAEALSPGALVWIQSDVLSIATSLRRLFWRHGGFAPSARHAAASSATVTRHWLSAPSSPPSPSSPSSPEGAYLPAPATDNGQRGAASTAKPTPAVRSATEEEPSCAPAAAAVAAAAAARAAAAGPLAAADAAAAALPPQLLRGPGLEGHREPWLTAEQVAAVAARHRHRRALGARRGRDRGCGGQGPACEEAGDSAAAAEAGGVVHASAAAAAAADSLGAGHHGCGGASGALRRAAAAAGGGVPPVAGRGVGREQEGEEGGVDREWRGGAAGREGVHVANDDNDDDDDGDDVCVGAGGGNGLIDDEGEGPAGGDGWAGLPWLDANPLGVPTEREVYVERGGRPIYRLLLVRR